MKAPRSPLLGRPAGFLKAMAVTGLFAAAMLGAGCATTSWDRGEDVEVKAERFSWATRECVAQEIGNPDYRNNEEQLRLCQLEHRVAELEKRLEEALAVPR